MPRPRYPSDSRIAIYVSEPDRSRFAELARADGLSVAAAARRLILRELRAAGREQREAVAR